jgi:hypothetical protein
VDLHQKKQNEQHTSLAGNVQEGFRNTTQRLDIMSDQGKQILEMTSTSM